MSRKIPGPYEPAEMERFLDTFMYREGAVLVDEILEMDRDAKAITALLDTAIKRTGIGGCETAQRVIVS